VPEPKPPKLKLHEQVHDEIDETVGGAPENELEEREED
jgi:hypothetical protein